MHEVEQNKKVEVLNMAKTIQVEKAPNFDLHFSHAIKVDNFLYVSGQVGVDSTTLELVGDSIEEQTEQCIKNIETILQAEGLTLNHIIKMNVFVSNSSDIPQFNNVYKKMLTKP